VADITSRRMGVFSRIKIDVPSGMMSTNRSLGSQPVSIPLVEPQLCARKRNNALKKEKNYGKPLDTAPVHRITPLFSDKD